MRAWLSLVLLLFARTASAQCGGDLLTHAGGAPFCRVHTAVRWTTQQAWIQHICSSHPELKTCSGAMWTTYCGGASTGGAGNGEAFKALQETLAKQQAEQKRETERRVRESQTDAVASLHSGSTAEDRLASSASRLRQQQPNLDDDDDIAIHKMELCNDKVDVSRYQSSQAALVGGTTWQHTGGKPSDCDAECERKFEEFLVRQQKLEREASDSTVASQLASQLWSETFGRLVKSGAIDDFAFSPHSSEYVDPREYRYVISMAGSQHPLADLLERVIWDNVTLGEFTRKHSAAYASIKRRKFERLDCHSNGAVLCLAALRSCDATAKVVRLFGPQINPSAAKEWLQLVQQKKLQLFIYIDERDPIPFLSWHGLTPDSPVPGKSDLQTALRGLFAAEVRAPAMIEILGRAGLTAKLLPCTESEAGFPGGRGLGCHSMARYQAHLRGDRPEIVTPTANPQLAARTTDCAACTEAQQRLAAEVHHMVEMRRNLLKTNDQLRQEVLRLQEASQIGEKARRQALSDSMNLLSASLGEYLKAAESVTTSANTLPAGSVGKIKDLIARAQALIKDVKEAQAQAEFGEKFLASAERVFTAAHQLMEQTSFTVDGMIDVLAKADPTVLWKLAKLLGGPSIGLVEFGMNYLSAAWTYAVAWKEVKQYDENIERFLKGITRQRDAIKAWEEKHVRPATDALIGCEKQSCGRTSDGRLE